RAQRFPATRPDRPARVTGAGPGLTPNRLLPSSLFDSVPGTWPTSQDEHGHDHRQHEPGKCHGDTVQSSGERRTTEDTPGEDGQGGTDHGDGDGLEAETGGVEHPGRCTRPL